MNIQYLESYFDFWTWKVESVFGLGKMKDYFRVKISKYFLKLVLRKRKMFWTQKINNVLF